MALLFLAGTALASWISGAAAGVTAQPAAKIIFVDVGAGDGVVMRVGDEIIVSDIGEFNIAEIYAALTKLGAKEVDVAILSHPHDDHIKNFKLLLDSRLFPVRRALLSRNDHWQHTAANRDVLLALERHHVPHTYVRAGQTYDFGGATWTILNPPQGQFRESRHAGNVSIVYLLEVTGHRLLFTGDIEKAGETEVLTRWTGSDPVDLVLVTHHGSNNASHPFFLDRVKPRVGVISVGPGHGHPSLEAVDRLRRAHVTLWCTNWNGSVTATVPTKPSSRITLRGERQSAAWWLRSERKSRGPCVGKVGQENN